ncbi:MAG: primosomal protein N', partial [Candidatus Saccharibacteria bacterium]|nr:primosomal protein N' [Candidatus Saccharibacteria bacterium]
IINKKVKKPDFPTKPIKELLESTPLPNHLLSAASWLSSYYLTPLPQAISLILPPGYKSPRKPEHFPTNPLKLPLIDLNPAQKQALKSLQSLTKATRLLHGVTGSGKTNIYQKLTINALQANKSTIILVPEIALTSQLVRVFEATFGSRITLIHSRLTNVERQKIWKNLLTKNSPEIVIGPRSALFSPLHNLGLIIIDEAHESTYFQEKSPKYSTLRLASFIANSLKIPCIQGTATPLISDYYLAKKNHSLVTLSEKAKKTAIQPKITIIDLKNHQNFLKNHYFSNPLLSAIKTNLENNHQTLIFHNRRGSAPLTICDHCAWQALCPNCYLPLTLHNDNYTLICHTCGHETPVPHSCPSCGHPDIIHKGFGTKLLELELNKLFKSAKIARFDADNNKKSSLDALYDDVKSGKFNIIIGTQTIAKGLDLPHLAAVGIVQADAGLSLPDFSSEEKTYHLLTQVIGRVGRGHLDSAEVFLQTYQPNHPVITSAIKNDYTAFSKYLLSSRQKSLLPPFVYLAKLSVTYKTESTTLKHIHALHNTLQSFAKTSNSLLISPPFPAFHEHTSSGFTWQLILKSSSRKLLLSALKTLPKTQNYHLTLDPPSLL